LKLPPPRKLGLVQINDIISGNLILPLAIGVLWQAAASNAKVREQWQVGHVVFAPDCDSDLEKLAVCDMVCFSTYVWNADYHTDLARRLRDRNPRCFIVFGGPHFTPNYPDFWQHYQGIIDLVVLGEGELALQELLCVFGTDFDPGSIAGAWTPTRLNPPAPRVTNLHQTPSPYLKGFYDDMVQYAYDHDLRLQATLQTNRGCPYHCTFCEEGVDYKNKIFVADLDTVKKEITWMGENKIEYLTLADDNWGIYKHDVDLMHHLCRTKLQYGYPRILDATYAKNNPENVLAIAKADRDFGTDLIRGITVALQSTHQPTLDVIRRFNLESNKQRDFVRGLHELGVPIYVELIWPLPYETWQHFRQGLDDSIRSGLDTWIVVYPLNMQTSAQLWHDYGNDYEFSSHQDSQVKAERMHIFSNKVVANKWVDHDQVVHGHVFFMWLSTLYFFGFGRPALQAMVASTKLSVCELIEDFIEWVGQLDDQDDLHIQQNRLRRHWSQWLNNQPAEPLGQFKDGDIDFWYPYTHHASWLQLNHAWFIERLGDWMLTHNIDPVKVQSLLDDCWHGTARYGQTYPYSMGGDVVALNHTPPEFNSCHEFCRYYYWWNRKRGYSVTRRTSNGT